MSAPTEPAPTEPGATGPPAAEPPAAEPAATGTDSTPAGEAPESEPSPCQRLTDFDDAAGWVVVNDGVMGGRSSGVVDVADSVLRFTGTVVTQGGGFTSVRYRLDGGELAGTSRIEMRVRADGRVYGLTFEDDAQLGGRSVSHRAELAIENGDGVSDAMVDADGWQVVSLTYDALRPTIFGRQVDAGPFDPGRAREIGIIIADGVDGDFALDVDWIDACG